MNKDNCTKNYTVSFEVTGVILPKGDLTGLSEEEILDALDSAYRHADCKNVYSVGGTADVRNGVFNAFAHCYITVEAADAEQAKNLASAKISTMDFGDIQNAAWELVGAEERTQKQTKNIKKSSEDRER